MSKAKDLLNKFNQSITETGEMSSADLEKGGEWYDARMELEKMLKGSKQLVSVQPFDAYQGPYALMKNGDKVWFTEQPGVYYVETKSGTTEMPGEDVAHWYKNLSKSKPRKQVKTKGGKK